VRLGVSFREADNRSTGACNDKHSRGVLDICRGYAQRKTQTFHCFGTGEVCGGALFFLFFGLSTTYYPAVGIQIADRYFGQGRDCASEGNLPEGQTNALELQQCGSCDIMRSVTTPPIKSHFKRWDLGMLFEHIKSGLLCFVLRLPTHLSYLEHKPNNRLPHEAFSQAPSKAWNL